MMEEDATVVINIKDLPEKPGYVAGEDGVNREWEKYPAWSVTKMIESDEFQDEGWKIAVRTYEAKGITGENGEPTGYNTFEMIRPDGSTFAILNAGNIDGKTGEFKDRNTIGGYAAVIFDDCMEGNEIVVPENMKAETVISESNGPDALLRFARAVKCAAQISASGLSYSPIDTGKETGINQNVMTRVFVEAATGDDDAYKKIIENTKDLDMPNPGLEQDLLVGVKGELYDDGMDGKSFVADSTLMQKFYKDLVNLQPNIAQVRAITFNKIEEIRDPSKQDVPETTMKPI